MTDNYSFGMEEEYFVVDAETKSIRRKASPAFLVALKRAIGPAFTREMLQSQIEVATKPLVTMQDALCRGEGSPPDGAAQSRPNTVWRISRPALIRPRPGRAAQQTPKVRYDELMRDFQMLGERNLLCGMHVHVELPDPDRRVDVMRRMLPYLPLFIALSTSSPFWRSRRTGLMGYRLAAYDELPRTGLPELFETNEDYEAYMEALIEARVIQDSSYVWWAIRPSAAHPTLELRAPDMCTRVEDAVALAALYRVACAASFQSSRAQPGYHRRRSRHRGRK